MACTTVASVPAAVAARSGAAKRNVAASAFVAGAPVQRQQQFLGGRSALVQRQEQRRQQRATGLQVLAVKDGAKLDRPLRVAVIGGGPSGACAAESLAKGGVETFLIERKMDNCKVGPVLLPLSRAALQPC